MWSQIVLCMLVGFAYASNTAAWKDNTEYVYQVRGRTLASLHEVANQYSGILTRSTLRVQLRPDGKLQAVICNPEYSQIHSQLEDWIVHLPDAELTWKPLEMSPKPFQMEMKQGVITDIIVHKNMPNWEANMIKSIVSQFQLNFSGNRQAYSKSQDEPTVYKVLEDTVTGNTETLYEIKEVPEYMVRNNEPWKQRLLQLKGDGEIIEVTKHKNYDHNIELPSYFFGFGEMRGFDAATNQMGEFFLRDSTSHALLTGDGKRFTIHNSYTVNRIMVNPTLTDKQKGSVVSMMNVTLEEVKSQSQIIEDVVEPLHLGNLVYTYEKPYSTMAMVSEKQPSRYRDTETVRYRESLWERIRHFFGSTDENTSLESEEHYKQEQPRISKAPASPFMPYTTGYKGKCVQNNMDIVESVKQLVQEIATELQRPSDILRHDTISKFTSMTSFIRVMHEEDIQRIVDELYTTSDVRNRHVEWMRTNPDGGDRHVKWVVLRDAIAEAGTGPAFRVIEKLILAKKIKGLEASQMISSMTDSVRQPTFEFMKSYFDLIKREEVRSQWLLNDTAILSFTELVSRVYFDEEFYKNQYPVKAFQKFHCKEGREFIKTTVIPYFTEELHKAISKAETHKIHAYIRALGNIGEPSILSAFEPYLEGQKKASHYQRLLMVVSMDRLAKTNPAVVRDVCFKIYQNTAEIQELRIAAVYRLMACQPTTEMLQIMASYTNVDSHEHVNAAVITSIERLANLEADAFYNIRVSAEAAKPLLIKKSYGLQYGGKYLCEHIIGELNQQYAHMSNIWGSQDHFYPKGFEFIANSNLKGLWSPIMNVRAYVSSLDELINVGKEQTYSYKEGARKQEEKSGEQKQYPWSSSNIAKLLNMKSEISEQLEGSIFNMELGSPIRMFSFDNMTIERLPEVIRQFQDEYKNGKKFNYHKILNSNDLALAFPTEMGLPFIYTYDVPMIYQVEGVLKMVSSPELSTNGEIHKPENIVIESDMSITVTSKMQGRLGFTTPFDHQQYIAGFDKHWQFHMPVYGNIDIDVKNGEIKFEFEPVEKHEGAHMFHYSTTPYTSRVDILSTQPLNAQPNTQVIKQQNMRHFDQIIGQKQFGMAFRVEGDHERKSLETHPLSMLFYKHGIVTGLMGFWNDASIQYSKFSVTYLPKESTTKKVQVRLGYQSKYKWHPDGAQNDIDWRQIREWSDAEKFQDRISSKVAEGIKNVKVYAVDASAELLGAKNIKFVFGAGHAKSDVDPKSRTMVYYKRTSDDKELKPYELMFESRGYIANTNALDLDFALEHQPEAKTTWELAFGPVDEQKTSKIQAEFDFFRSEERKQYLRQLPLYHQCKQEMRGGNKQLPACLNMTISANLLDRTNVEIKYENLKDMYVEAARSAYDVFSYKYLPALEITKGGSQIRENQISVQTRFHPDLKFVNLTVESQSRKTEFKDIAASDLIREVFVVHPVFHLPSRMMGKTLFGLETYRPMCVVDQSEVSTFNNLTYPAEISNKWTVMLQYVPEVARRHFNQEIAAEQLAHQVDNYVVLVRKNSMSNEKRDIKIVVSTPETDFETIDITMTPSKTTSPKAIVTVDNKQVRISDEESYDIHNGYVKLYALPNGEVKCEVDGAFYIIYDGYRARFTAFNGKFRGDVRGLCGRFNDQRNDDFSATENCIARDFWKFVKSFEIEGQEGKQIREEFSRFERCSRKQYPLYYNVISAEIEKEEEQRADKCSITQTRYVQLNGEICFTTEPLMSCKSQCQVRGWVTKNVPVHCIRKSNVSQLWKTQIDKGSSPDFSHKEEHRRVDMQVPQSCSE